ncbi:MAG: hypothetical protein FJW88_05740 [Actinobacteria bacterium]|nr:hypothetical protein [Actinomycetota bacterium]
MTRVVEPDEAEPLEAIPVVSTREGIIAAIVAWAALFLVIGFAGWFVWTRVIDPSAGSLVSRYADGDAGNLYEGVGDQFRVVLPSEWRRHTRPSPLGEIVRVESKPGAGYLYSVTVTPQPESALEAYPASLDAAIDGFAKQHQARVVSSTKPVPFDDVAVAYGTFRRNDTWWRALFMLAPDRLYTVVEEAPNDSEDGFNRMTKSFTIIGAG